MNENKKESKLIKKIKKLFNKKENILIYKDKQKNKIEKAKKEKEQIYKVSPDEKNKIFNKYENIIEHAKEIKQDKEKYKKLQNDYIDALKTNDRKKVEKTKNMLWDLQNNINLSESFLRSKLKEIKKIEINEENKTKLINYICGIAKIKTKEKSRQMNESKQELLTDSINELNIKKEKILASKQFTIYQKKNMIREIDDELIELSKREKDNTAK